MSYFICGATDAGLTGTHLVPYASEQGVPELAAASIIGVMGLTNVPGSSNYLLADLVTYSNDSKLKILGVRAETLKQYGAVSEQCVLEIHVRVRKQHVFCAFHGARQFTYAEVGLAESDLLHNFIVGRRRAVKT